MLSAWLHRFASWFRDAASSLGGGGRRALVGWLAYTSRLPIGWAPAFSGFGRLERRDEFLSILDNFLRGTLRSDRVERALREARAPVVVDVGVNLGVTVRWWLHLNPASQVVAVDMMREAIDYSSRRVHAVAPEAHVTWIEAVVGREPGEVEVRFDDPLKGTNRSDGGTGATCRRLPTSTLDGLLGASPASDEVMLLKVDIEGAGGSALAGATALLRRTRFVVVEYHDVAETAEMTRVCLAAGLSLACANEKMLFFERVSWLEA